MEITDLADRTNVFYWQTDRSIEPAEAGRIWADRHSVFNDEEILDSVNGSLSEHKLISLVPFSEDAHTNLGNINSIRIGTLDNGEEVVIRCHPKGISNGYFYAESLIAEKLIEHDLPAYKTYAVHEFEGEKDFSFQVISKLPGVPTQTWLENNPDDEKKLVHIVGATMAKMAEVKVQGFGPFDNDKAKKGELIGLHSNLESAMRASLDFNLDVLQQTETITKVQSQAADELFINNPLLKYNDPVFVHNDFADWNQLTDGKTITGIIDLDEAVGGHPVADIACWSTFFNPERLDKFLEGYFSVSPEIENFKELFELFRLRYIISKMTLRLRRATWCEDQWLKEKIEVGRLHLAESLKHYGI